MTAITGGNRAWRVVVLVGNPKAGSRTRDLAERAPIADLPALLDDHVRLHGPVPTAVLSAVTGPAAVPTATTTVTSTSTVMSTSTIEPAGATR